MASDIRVTANYVTISHQLRIKQRRTKGEQPKRWRPRRQCGTDDGTRLIWRGGDVIRAITLYLVILAFNKRYTYEISTKNGTSIDLCIRVSHNYQSYRSACIYVCYIVEVQAIPIKRYYKRQDHDSITIWLRLWFKMVFFFHTNHVRTPINGKWPTHDQTANYEMYHIIK